jgi:hypothetical protein
MGVHGPPPDLPELLLRLEGTLLDPVASDSASRRQSTLSGTIQYNYLEKKLQNKRAENGIERKNICGSRFLPQDAKETR